MTSYRNGRNTLYKRIDVPEICLFKCFYCGDIATEDDHFPPLSRLHDYRAIYNTHAPLLIPSCHECNSLLSSSLQVDIYARFEQIKKKLTTKYGRFVRLGNTWSSDDIEDAELTGSFKSMIEAIPKMSKITSFRLSWQHWPVEVEGQVIEEKDNFYVIKIDGKQFKSLDYLFEYARKVDRISSKYLQSVIDVVGSGSITYAYNLCKTNPIKTEAQLNQVILDLKELIHDESFYSS